MHKPSSAVRTGARVAATLAAAGLLGLPARADARPGPSADEPSLKAAFLYNFMKFTEWPVDDDGRPAALVACTTSAPIAAALQQIVASKTGAARTIAVRRVEGSSASGCSLLHVAAADARKTPALLASVQHAAVLTVGDQCEFADAGGLAYFFLEDGRLRFAIAASRAASVHLNLSSQLLALARLITDHQGSPS